MVVSCVVTCYQDSIAGMLYLAGAELPGAVVFCDLNRRGWSSVVD